MKITILKKGWDGFPPKDIDASCVYCVETFINLLPNEVRLPIFCISNDGNPLLMWYSYISTLVLTFLPGNQITIGLSKQDQLFSIVDTIVFDFTYIPNKLINTIRKYFSSN